jgi:asparagine synthetase B (glutamine-hydrolysing)
MKTSHALLRDRETPISTQINRRRRARRRRLAARVPMMHMLSGGIHTAVNKRNADKKKQRKKMTHTTFTKHFSKSYSLQK